jgi:DNA-binding NtrC family response regulator
VVLTRSEAIGVDDLPLAFRSEQAVPQESPGDSLPSRLGAIEKKIIMDALKNAGGNQSRAARELGISEKNIRDRLKKWGYKDD